MTSDSNLLRENIELKQSPLTIHTKTMDTFNEYLDLKDAIEAAFLRMDVIELGFLEIKYFGIRNDMAHNLQWMMQVCGLAKKTSILETNELMGEVKDWALKVEKYYQILICFKNSIGRRSIHSN